MYIISLIFAIIACICAFLPFYGVIFAILLGVFSIVFSAINVRSAEKKIKEISIISIIVSVFAFIMCIGINIYTAFFEDNNLGVEDIGFSNLSENYPLYSSEDGIKDEKIYFKLDDNEIKDDKIYISYTITFFGEERDFSAFDFYILDESSDEIYYLTYDNESGYIYNAKLGNGETINAKMKFVLNNGYNIDNLYLVYKNENSNFKIKI